MIEAPGLGSIVVDQAQRPTGSAPVTPGAPSVVALLYTADVREGAETAVRLGFRPRISADGGGWADLLGYGILAFHAGEAATVDGAPACEISLEVGDLAPLQTRTTEAGLQAHLIDEAYGRTLRVATPDGGELWVNETQRDLYGYRLAGTGEEARWRSRREDGAAGSSH